jgi:hypothetical protein
MSELETLTKKLVKLSMEKRLRDTLYEVAGELPEEILDDIYRKMYRPVMIATMLKIKEGMKNVPSR